MVQAALPKKEPCRKAIGEINSLINKQELLLIRESCGLKTKARRPWILSRFLTDVRSGFSFFGCASRCNCNLAVCSRWLNQQFVLTAMLPDLKGWQSSSDRWSYGKTI
jgi:hypothetical protein